ncbi:MAG TPA: ABC transporter permease [Azospirillaceae bacterium]|nr:ABC transporter permease [Azospirillaceae bacterium]
MAGIGGVARPAGGGLPWWASVVVLPLLNVAAAFLVSALVFLAIGADPLDALRVLVAGAFGDPELLGLTLYYTTNYVFTGLAVAIAFHCGLFNIGADGQAYVAGLGAGLAVLAMNDWPWWLAAPVAVAAAAACGAGWAYGPGYLQAKRGSHIVITTIMFNFIAAALMNYMLVEVLIERDQQIPQSRAFDRSTWLPALHDVLAVFGIQTARSPLNVSLLLALACCAAFYVFVWHTRWGYEIRTVGQNERAAVYAGISPSRNIILAMCLSGALAGFVAINELMGVHHRIIIGFTGGAGFVGIAVALMGRNHPVGIVLSALLFGALRQGGAELNFEFPNITPEMVVVIQGLIILFAGALENLFRPQLEALFRRRPPAVAA